MTQTALRKVKAILSVPSRLLLWIAAGVVGLMVVHVTSDVLGRALFATPSPATTEFVAYYYMVLLVFLPIPELERRDQNIVVDLFYLRMPKLVKRLVLILGFLCAIAFFGMLTLQSWTDAWNAYDKGEMVDGYFTVTIWPARFAMPLAFGLATLVLCIRLIDEALFGVQAVADSEGTPQSHDESGVV